MSYLRKIIPNSRISDIGRSTISSISVGMPIGLLLSLTYASQVITTERKFEFPISRIGEQLSRNKIKDNSFTGRIGKSLPINRIKWLIM